MTLFLLILILCAIRVVLYHLYLIQRKEYRPDRYREFLKTAEAKNLYRNPASYVKWIGLIVSIFVAGIWREIAITVFALTAVLELGYIIFLSRYFKKPRFTFRVLLLLNLIGLQCLFILKAIKDPIVVAMILDRFAVVIIWTSVTVTWMFTHLVIKLMTNFARKKVASMKHLKVIGVCGSYGKTTTKEFISHLIESRYPVLKTPLSHNTEIAVSKWILKNLNRVHRFLIVEMGEYQKGDVAAICRITPPDHVVICGINEEHLGLFGSMEKTTDTVLEAVAWAKKGACIYLNMDDAHLRAVVGRIRGMRSDATIILTSSHHDVYAMTQTHEASQVYMSHVNVYHDSIWGRLHVKNSILSIQAQLISETFIPSMTLAAAVANRVGIPTHLIRNRIAKLTSVDGRKQLKKIKDGWWMIDDTYNANPDGIIAGINHLKRFPGHKVLVLSPLLELGNATSRVYHRIGKEAALVNNQIYLFSSEGKKKIMDGMHEIKSSEIKPQLTIIHPKDYIKIATLINRFPQGVIYLSGRQAKVILSYLEEI